MANSITGRTMTGSKEMDELVEQLDSLRFQLKDSLHEEQQAQALVHHCQGALRQAEHILDCCMKRTRQTVAELTLMEKHHGYTGLTEVVDDQTVRIDGLTVKIPADNPGARPAPLNDPAAVGRFVGAIVESTKTRVAAKGTR